MSDHPPKQTTLPTFDLALEVLNLFSTFDQRTRKQNVEVNGREVLYGSSAGARFRAEFWIDRQALGRGLRLRVGDAVVFADLDAQQRRNLSLAIKERFVGLVRERMAEIVILASNAEV